MDLSILNRSNETGTADLATNDTELELFEICRLAKNGSANYSGLDSEFLNRTLWKLNDNLVSYEALASVYVLIFVVAFLWNFFLLAVMIARRKIFKEAAHVFLFNLILLDFLATLLITLFAIVATIPREWLFGLTDVVRCYTCDVQGFFVVFLIDTSVHILACLSLDRVLHLSYPLKYKDLMTRNRAIIIVVIIWVVLFILNILPFFGVGIIEFNRQLGVCLVRWSRTTLTSYIYVGVLLVELLVPIFILIFGNTFTYKLITKVLKRAHTRKKNLLQSSTRRKLNVKEQEQHQTDKSEEQRNYRQQQLELARYFGALFISNIVCWFMLFIMFILVAVLPPERFPPDIFSFGFVMYLLTTVIHPILETYFIQDLRLLFRNIKTGMKRELSKHASMLDKSRKLASRDSESHTIHSKGRTELSYIDPQMSHPGGQANPAYGHSIGEDRSGAVEETPVTNCHDDVNAVKSAPLDAVENDENKLVASSQRNSNESGVFSVDAGQDQ